jgi:hypothetical protein
VVRVEGEVMYLCKEYKKWRGGEVARWRGREI